MPNINPTRILPTLEEAYRIMMRQHIPKKLRAELLAQRLGLPYAGTATISAGEGIELNGATVAVMASRFNDMAVLLGDGAYGVRVEEGHIIANVGPLKDSSRITQLFAKDGMTVYALNRQPTSR